MTDSTITEEQRSKAEVIGEIIRGITNRRWLKLQRSLDADLGEINANQVLLMVVAANEKHFQACGQDGLERFLDMTLEQISEFLGLTEPEATEDAEPVAV